MSLPSPAQPVAMSVAGPVPTDELGPTLMHEHLFIDFRARHQPTGEVEPDAFDPQERWRYVQRPTAYALNLVRDDPVEAAREVAAFTGAGGGTIVDVTTEGLGHDRRRLRDLARATGVTIVASAGYYVHASHPEELHAWAVDELADRMTSDVLVGDDDGIRCGFIGELGVDGFEPCELDVVIAGARAQAATGASVAVHTASGVLHDQREATLALVHAYIDAGGDPARLVLCHHDGSGDDPGYQERLLREGIVLSYDTFGFETGFRREDRYVQLPTDTRRIAELRDLWDRGWGEQVVLSHDVCYRMMTRSWGGWGIGHLLASLPERFELGGLGGAELSVMLERTPARLLALPRR